ncbi:hypothetical protein SteCoe_10421 [Stentor coeruleus]|uniref:Uncharacterized protein n=1 Tax=Stentor coeruleus TaxID=5963 RepID=A0A1R2CFI3_9CILI|nr:hypothetical protein SteCoe_10421 [Stentor coeruleus]
MDNHRVLEVLPDNVLRELSTLEMNFKKKSESRAKVLVLTGSLNHDKIRDAAKSIVNQEKLSNPCDYLQFLIELHENERLNQN